LAEYSVFSLDVGHR